MKNFTYTLLKYLKELELDYPVRIGIYDDEMSLVIKPLEGSEMIRKYMNGMMDIRLPFQLSIKSKNQEEAFNELAGVMNHIQNMNDFLESEEIILLDINTDQNPVFESTDEDGYFYYSSKLTVDLTVT